MNLSQAGRNVGQVAHVTTPRHACPAVGGPETRRRRLGGMAKDRYSEIPDTACTASGSAYGALTG